MLAVKEHWLWGTCLTFWSLSEADTLDTYLWGMGWTQSPHLAALIPCFI